MRTAAQRAAWARYMKKNRADRKAAGRCRQCKNPAARALDGRTMSACNDHLDADAERVKNRRVERKAKP